MGSTPPPVQRGSADQGVGGVSTVGSSVAELTARRITGARGRDVSAALYARAHLAERVRNAMSGCSSEVGAFRASPSAGGTLGLSYGTPARAVGCNASMATDSITREWCIYRAARQRDVFSAIADQAVNNPSLP